MNLQPARRYQVFSAALALAGLFAFSLLETMLAPVLPQIGRELGIAPAGLGLAYIALLLAGVVSAPLIGRLADLHDKPRVLGWTLTIASAGVLLSAMARDIRALALGQLLQGVGMALVPLCIGLLNDASPARRTSFGSGLVVAAMTASTALGLLICGTLVDALGFRSIYWVALALLAPCALGMFLLTRIGSRPQADSSRHVDWAGAGLLASALIVLLLGLKLAPRWSWASAATWGMFASAAALFACLLHVQRKIESPLLDPSLFARKSVALTCVIAFAAGFASMSCYYLAPLIAQSDPALGFGLGASVSESALYLLPLAIGGTIAAPLAGLAAGPLGSRFVMIAGALALLVGSASLALLHDEPWHILLSMTLMGVAVGCVLTEAMNIAVDAAGKQRAASISGIVFVIRSVGALVGVQVSASMLSQASDRLGASAHAQGYANALIVTALVSAAALVAALSFPARAHSQLSQNPRPARHEVSR